MPARPRGRAGRRRAIGKRTDADARTRGTRDEGRAERVVIVTGAAQGMGRAICSTFASEGARVWACDIDGAGLEETARSVEGATGHACRTELVDVTDPRAVSAFVDAAGAAANRDGNALAVLVNNAGGVAGQTGQAVEDVTDEAWHAIVGVNLDGAFHFSRAVAPHMKRAGRGCIVNISSGAGRSYSLTGIQAYAAAKAGLIGLTRQLARELGAFGIRVNCVAPGFVRSNPASERQWRAMGENGQRALLESIAMRRLGSPEEIAAVVAFFASDQASYVTGQTLSADGGTWMHG